MVNDETKVLVWAKVRHYYGTILLGDPLDKNPILAELEIAYWAAVSESRRQITILESNYHRGWWEGFPQGIHESLQFRLTPEWSMSKQLKHLNDTLNERLRLWHTQNINQNNHRVKTLRQYRLSHKPWPDNWGQEVGSSTDNGRIDGNIQGLRYSIKIMLGEWFWHAKFPKTCLDYPRDVKRIYSEN